MTFGMTAAGLILAGWQYIQSNRDGDRRRVQDYLTESGTLYLAGRRQEALDILSKAEKLDPQNPEVLKREAVLHMELGHLELAKEAARRAFTFAPENPKTGYTYAQILEKGGARQESVQVIESVTRQHPEFGMGWNLLGTMYLTQHRCSDAAAALDAAMRAGYDGAEVRVNHGLVLGDCEGDDQGAIVWFQDAIAHDQNYPPAHEKLVAALIRLKRYADAIGPAETFVRLRPADAKAHHMLALALDGAHRFAEALREYRSALAYDACLCDALLNSSAILLQESESEAALGDTRRLLECSNCGDMSVVHINRGEALLQLNRKEEAAHEAELASRALPGLSATWQLMGEVAEAQGDPAMAETYYARGLERDPENNECRQRLDALKHQ
ncbi:MAG TPA: tetratricopeptide repeat protein [Planctomycetota bacterium]|nr:tetratricopeptide repeat protein [Planctomycetota bacterium]